jgi:hypothetical protein
MKQSVGEAFAEFIDTVYRTMDDSERNDLPQETMDYVDAMVAYALNRLPQFGDKLAFTVAKVYKGDPWVRFIKDPLRSNDISVAYLFLDNEGYLVSVINPQIATTTSIPNSRYMKDCDSYVLLNGPLKDKKFYSHNRPLGEPIYKSQSHTFKESYTTSGHSAKGKTVPVRVFISYAHKDEKLKDELLEHLSGLKKNEIISDWTDREILAGERWEERIKENLEDSRLILFLVSASFMHSDYIKNIEIKRSIERHEKGEAVIVPIIIRSCDFKSLPLHEFQALPKNAKPIEDWKPRNKGWLDVINQLKNIISDLE